MIARSKALHTEGVAATEAQRSRTPSKPQVVGFPFSHIQQILLLIYFTARVFCNGWLARANSQSVRPVSDSNGQSVHAVFIPTL